MKFFPKQPPRQSLKHDESPHPLYSEISLSSSNNVGTGITCCSSFVALDGLGFFLGGGSSSAAPPTSLLLPEA